jgi:hypothetical protein
VSDDTTETPVVEETQDQSQVSSTPDAPDTGTSVTEAPEPFSEGFDPATLDEPLRDRYRQMEAGLHEEVPGSR